MRPYAATEPTRFVPDLDDLRALYAIQRGEVPSTGQTLLQEVILKRLRTNGMIDGLTLTDQGRRELNRARSNMKVRRLLDRGD